MNGQGCGYSRLERASRGSGGVEVIYSYMANFRQKERKVHRLRGGRPVHLPHNLQVTHSYGSSAGISIKNLFFPSNFLMPQRSKKIFHIKDGGPRGSKQILHLIEGVSAWWAQ